MRKGLVPRSPCPCCNYTCYDSSNQGDSMRNRFFVALGFAAALPIGAAAQTQQASSAARPINLQDTIPFDAAVRTGTLPNGLKFYVRQNSRPAARVSLRLSVKAGSINEADDQQGLAHLIEHMAFNGS